MESKVTPTSMEFLIHKRDLSLSDGQFPTPQQVSEWMHEYAVLFARHHVEQALKAAIENVELYKDSKENVIVDEDSILNAYKEDRIQ